VHRLRPARVRALGGDPQATEPAPDTLRHTFGSELARRGVSVSTIAALMGHSLAAAGSNAITHYIQVHGPELREAMAKLWA
jgi:integrase